MRTLLWFTLGFCVSCGICGYDLALIWLLPVVGSLVVAVLTIRHFLRPVILILAGIAAGLGWFGAYSHFYLKPVEEMKDQQVFLSVTASDYSYETAYGTAVDAHASIDGKSYQTRIYMDDAVEINPGDCLEGTFLIRLTKPDENDASAYYQGKGIWFFAYEKGETILMPQEDASWRCIPARLRHRLLSALQEIFPADTAAFSKALLLGYSHGLDYATDTALKISGIRHIVAVSGLHISILYGLICTLTVKRRYLTVVVGMPVLLLFAAVAGFTPSVNRACIMAGLMMLSQVMDREYDAPTALSFAVLVMLILNPLAVTSVSLQLSVGCVAGILLFNAPINSWMKAKLPGRKGVTAKLQTAFCSSISVTLSAMSLVTPLCACYFGTVSLVGILTNLLTLWAVNLVFNGLIVTCVLYFIAPGGAAILAGILSWAVRYVLFVARTLSAFPMAAVYTCSIYIVFWLILVYLLLAVFLVMKKKQPLVLICCGVLGLCAALCASWVEPVSAQTSITMLDVGQGQSILLHSEGKTFLVDCGGDSETGTADLVAETLLSQGISRLDGVILTHYDTDHAGAVHNLMTRIRVDHLYLPDIRNEFENPVFEGKIIPVWENLDIRVGGTNLRIYGPVYSGMDNENSLCVLFDTQKCDILITGDRSGFGERMLMRKNLLPDVDILVAGHHGASDSATEELLQAVTPETVLISVSKDNRYGHPAPELLERLQRFGCAVYRTDLNGTITIRR